MKDGSHTAAESTGIQNLAAYFNDEDQRRKTVCQAVFSETSGCFKDGCRPECFAESVHFFQMFCQSIATCDAACATSDYKVGCKRYLFLVGFLHLSKTKVIGHYEIYNTLKSDALGNFRSCIRCF